MKCVFLSLVFMASVLFLGKAPEVEAMLSEKSQRVCASLTAAVENLLEEIGGVQNLTAAFRRKMANKFFLDQSGIAFEMESVDKTQFTQSDDGAQIPLRIYTPRHVESGTTVMFVHGGGWSQGNLDTHEYLCKKIAETFHVKVVSVGYRLAPEHAFPTPLNDVFAAYKWCIETYEGEKIILSGDSAGGNLCAALCVKLGISAEVLPKPEMQLLFYPVLSNDFNTQSFNKFANIPALTALGTKLFANGYVGEDAERVTDKLVFPSLETNVSVFPTTVIISAENDVLIDGNRDFLKKLERVGISVQHIIMPGAVHGFATYGKEFDAEVSAVLEEITLP